MITKGLKYHKTQYVRAKQSASRLVSLFIADIVFRSILRKKTCLDWTHTRGDMGLQARRCYCSTYVNFIFLTDAEDRTLRIVIVCGCIRLFLSI